VVETRGNIAKADTVNAISKLQEVTIQKVALFSRAKGL